MNTKRRLKRFTEEQSIGILKEADAGLGVKELTRKHGIAEGTYYRWRTKYVGLDVSEAKRGLNIWKMRTVG